ncbi:MAG: 50S ribosomal protein L30 [Actinobacteria bacterium]|nr:50S ribosomal protein L30 [Actinomycetota bacterium]
MADVIEITQVRSPIGAPQSQRRTLRALGLRRIHQTVTQADRPEIHGMLAKVAHLIEVRRPGDDAPMGLEPGQEPSADEPSADGPSNDHEEAAS